LKIYQKTLDNVHGFNHPTFTKNFNYFFKERSPKRMEATAIQPEWEYKILKEKYNRLIDMYSSLQKENENLKHQNFSLIRLGEMAAEQEKTEKIQENPRDPQDLQPPKSYTTDEPDCTQDIFYEFFMSYITIIRKALEANAFIPYAYASKNAKNYLKIEKNIFEQLIVENTTIPLKTFREFCGGFMLIKSEDNKFTFANDKQTVYYINKFILNCITVDPNPVTALPTEND